MKFIGWIGHPRGVNTFFAAILDALLNVAIAYKPDIQQANDIEQLAGQIIDISRAQDWQKFTIPEHKQEKQEITHVGICHPDHFMQYPGQLPPNLPPIPQENITLLNIIRNPFDNVATLSAHNGTTLEYEIVAYTTRCQTIATFYKANFNIIEIDVDRFFDYTQTRTNARRLAMQFNAKINVTPWSFNVKKIALPHPRKIATAITWPRKYIYALDEAIKQFEWLTRKIDDVTNLTRNR